MNHDVFISYSSKNRNAAFAILHELEENGIKCWIAPRDITSGLDYGDLIDEAIKRCRVFLLIYSEYSLNSKWCKGELNIAFTEEKTIIPYRIDTAPLKGAMSVILNQYHWIDSYPDFKTRFKELIKAIGVIIGTYTSTNNQQKKLYSIGDYYDDGAKRGVVIEINSNGSHGKIISLEQKENAPWGIDRNYGSLFSQDNPKKNKVGCDNKNDGITNMRVIQRIFRWKEKYPAFAWCLELGDDWYLPAKNELNSLTKNDILSAVNKTLISYNAAPFPNKGDSGIWYWSSSEDDSERDCAYYIGISGVYWNDDNLYSDSGYKSTENRVRAISVF